MKKILFVGLLFSFLCNFAIAQSDCGNCYIAGQSCIVTLDCGDAAWQVAYIVHCDYDPCSYVYTTCQYECPSNVANSRIACNLSHIKNITTKSVITPFSRSNSLNLFSYFATLSNTLHIPIAWFLPNKGV